MKNLYVIRHAKSSWNFSLGDHDRPLGKRGRKDLKVFPAFIAARCKAPELLLTSTASRAMYTALGFCDAWKMNESQIQLSPDLYHASSTRILTCLSKTNNEIVAIFGHNPGLEDLIDQLTDDPIAHFPTCAFISIRFDVCRWSDLEKGIGKVQAFHIPRELSS